jgi:hypothetical protein
MCVVLCASRRPRWSGVRGRARVRRCAAAASGQHASACRAGPCSGCDGVAAHGTAVPAPAAAPRTSRRASLSVLFMNTPQMSHTAMVRSGSVSALSSAWCCLSSTSACCVAPSAPSTSPASPSAVACATSSACARGTHSSARGVSWQHGSSHVGGGEGRAQACGLAKPSCPPPPPRARAACVAHSRLRRAHTCLLRLDRVQALLVLLLQHLGPALRIGAVLVPPNLGIHVADELLHVQQQVTLKRVPARGARRGGSDTSAPRCQAAAVQRCLGGLLCAVGVSLQQAAGGVAASSVAAPVLLALRQLVPPLLDSCPLQVVVMDRVPAAACTDKRQPPPRGCVC